MKYVAHTDIVALKAFFLGLMAFDWQPLPADPVLLVHLALVAALMIVFPDEQAAARAGRVLQPEPQPGGRCARAAPRGRLVGADRARQAAATRGG